jgi:hypothetical protein
MFGLNMNPLDMAMCSMWPFKFGNWYLPVSMGSRLHSFVEAEMENVGYRIRRSWCRNFLPKLVLHESCSSDQVFQTVDIEVMAQGVV